MIPIVLAPLCIAAPPNVVAQEPDADEPRLLWTDVDDFEVVGAHGVVVVTTPRGNLRAIDAATGELRAEYDALENDRGVTLVVDREGNVWATSSERVTRLDPMTLEAEFDAQVDGDAGWSVPAPSGDAIALRAKGDSVVLVDASASDRREEHVTLKHVDTVRGMSFDPTGARLVTVTADTAEVFETTTGKSVAKFHPLGDLPWSSACFAGAKRLVVGTDGARVMKAPQLVVFDLDEPEAVAVVDLDVGLPFGGRVSTIQGFTEPDVVVASISSAGVLCAIRTSDAEPVWTHDFGGGNPGSLVLHRIEGTKVATCSGMTPDHSCALELATGRIVETGVAGAPLDLRGTGGRGRERPALVVWSTRAGLFSRPAPGGTWRDSD